jgi:phospholipid transport system substrate-binding protein
MSMPTRRIVLTASLAAAAVLGAGLLPRWAWAQTPAQASAFVDQAGKELIAVVNGPGSAADKQAKLKQIVDKVVDVEEVGRFCLGRFWRTAKPAEQQQYLQLFHQVLLKNVAGKLGDYQGVTFVVGRTTPRDGGTVGVATVVTRPNVAPANVEWVVGFASGSPRIVDVVAEGTSLRLTQRSDYASFLSHNGDSVTALMDAMRKQLSQPG